MSNSPFDPYDPLFPLYQPPGSPKRPLSLADLLRDIKPQTPPKTFDLSVLEALLPKNTLRPRIFVSYQHSSDQYYYNEFSRVFHDSYETIYDNSLRGCIRSDNPEYVIQRIRDEFITGTSCTIVLIGPTTFQRKYVDWEIKATLDREHGLIGVQLPNVIPYLGRVSLPERLNANINSGYALWQGFTWNQLLTNPAMLNQLIQIATDREKSRIINPREIKKQNG